MGWGEQRAREAAARRSASVPLDNGMHGDLTLVRLLAEARPASPSAATAAAAAAAATAVSVLVVIPIPIPIPAAVAVAVSLLGEVRQRRAEGAASLLPLLPAAAAAAAAVTDAGEGRVHGLVPASNSEKGPNFTIYMYSSKSVRGRTSLRTECIDKLWARSSKVY